MRRVERNWMVQSSCVNFGDGDVVCVRTGFGDGKDTDELREEQ